MTYKEPRPNIPKLLITKVGEFNSPLGWSFDGKSDPNSVGNYISKDWNLYGGYTIQELNKIKLSQDEL